MTMPEITAAPKRICARCTLPIAVDEPSVEDRASWHPECHDRAIADGMSRNPDAEAFIPLDYPAMLRGCRAERDKAYRDRAELLAVLAASMPAQLVFNADSHATPRFWPVLFINTPAGQMSWHINPADADLFPPSLCRWSTADDVMVWDGHDNREKSRRLREFANVLRIAREARE